MIKYISFTLILLSSLYAENNFYRNWIDDYDLMLKRYVITYRTYTQMNYKDLRNDSDFKKLVGTIGGTKGKHARDDWARLSKDEQTAFRINFYNFLAINLVVQNPGLESLKELETKTKKPLENIVAGYMHRSAFTLKRAKDLVITASKSDPMVIFALNRASQGDPSLRPEAYRGDSLHRQLYDQFEIFMRSDLGLETDHRGRKLFVSKIFRENSELFGDDIKEWLFRHDVIDRHMLRFELYFMDQERFERLNCPRGQN